MLLCCLKCTSVLEKARIEDIEVDLCGSCGGLWLDHGEAERLAKKMGSELDRLRKLLRSDGGPPPVPSDVQGTCPACTSAVKEVKLGAVTVDYCPRCKGLFMDRGEFDGALTAVTGQKMTVAQIVAAAVAEVDAQPEPAGEDVDLG
jgi:Zn-finger nucleic acid-binding protein